MNWFETDQKLQEEEWNLSIQRWHNEWWVHYSNVRCLGAFERGKTLEEAYEKAIKSLIEKGSIDCVFNP